MKSFFKKHAFSIVFFSSLFLFSIWLMWHTFNYHDSTFYIASKVWGDFAANLPLIRSFSLGSNFPPEYPLFPGEPIRYHFLFYLLVGLLEKTGLRLDWALNLPSALSFFFLAVIIYFLAKELFKSKAVAFLSVIFFLFNATFSFMEFLKNHPFSPLSPLSLLSPLIHLKEFPSFMPYGPGEVTAFWSLNTFVNQRHLALGFGILLLMVYWLLKINCHPRLLFCHSRESGNPGHSRETWILGSSPRMTMYAGMTMGLLFGLFPSLHKAVFVMAGLVFFCLFLFFKKLRKTIIFIIFISFIIALPQLYFTNQLNAQTSGSISFYPGYLVYGQGLLAFLRHWLMNLGLNVFLIPLGFILAPRQAKKIFLAFFSLFVIANLFKFSPEISANHKFFNLFIIVGNMYTAYALVKIFSAGDARGGSPVERAQPQASTSDGTSKRQDPRWRILVRATTAGTFLVLIFFLTFSGIIDFFVIKNDFQYQIVDAPKNPDVLFIKTHTPKKSTFLTTSYFYHSANLAGRKIFYGWPYYAWSAGYQTEERKELVREIFASQKTEALCQLLKTNKIDYVALDKDFSQLFWQKNFVPVYDNEVTDFKIYQTKAICLGSL